MVSNREKRLDRLTNTWTEAAAEVMINEYLKEAENSGADGLFLLEAANGGTKLPEASVKQAAFLLQCTLRRTDLVARVGENCFLVFLLGCQPGRCGLFHEQCPYQPGAGNGSAHDGGRCADRRTGTDLRLSVKEGKGGAGACEAGGEVPLFYRGVRKNGDGGRRNRSDVFDPPHT